MITSPLPSIPVSDPVLVVAIGTVLFLSVPLVFDRLRIPAVIGLILAGAAIGPHGFNVLRRDSTVVLLGTVGLLYLMFMAAVEVDLHRLNRSRAPSVILGVAGFTVPLTLGYAAGIGLGYALPAAVLFGSLLASHTLLAYPTASRLGIANNRAVATAVGATIITDVLVLLVLTVVEARVDGTLGVAFWARLVVSISVFAAAVLVGLPRIARAFFRRQDAGEIGEFMFVIAAIATSAVAAQLAGLEPIIGAFFAGLALNVLVAEGTPLHNRLQFFGNALLVPFFLLSVGMLVDLRVFLSGSRVWLVMATMVLAALAGKWIAAKVTAWRFGYSRDEQRTMFGLSVPQAAATLAVVLVGYRIKLFNDAILNGAIVLILVTCTVGPWLVQWFGRRVALDERQAPAGRATSPQRILIPVIDHGDARALVDVALLIRQPGSKEPLLPTMVVEQYRGDPRRIATVEKLLASIVAYGAGAGVPMIPFTRVDRHAASGFVRAIAEGRPNTVVAGWDGKRTRRTGVLSTLLDELLARTREMTVIAHIHGALTVTKRVVLVVPRHTARSTGFAEAVETVKLLTNRLGAVLRIIAVGPADAALRTQIDEMRPAVSTTWQDAATLQSVSTAIVSDQQTDDLVIVLSERRGMLAWRRDLDRFPRRLVQRGVSQLFVIYPNAGDSQGDGVPALGQAIQARRIALAIPQQPLAGALRTILATGLSEGSGLLPRALAAATEWATDGALELAPGAVFLGGRIPRLNEPMLFLGISPDGLELPKVRHPSRIVLIVLCPSSGDGPSRYLAELAPLFSNAERVEAFSRCTDSDAVAGCFRSDVRPSDQPEEEAGLDPQADTMPGTGR